MRVQQTVKLAISKMSRRGVLDYNLGTQPDRASQNGAQKA